MKAYAWKINLHPGWRKLYNYRSTQAVNADYFRMYQNTIEQAGAELCQAQEKLGLV